MASPDLVEIALILAEGLNRFKNSENSVSIRLAIPAPQSDESKPRQNSTNHLSERGSDD